jgi:isopentenyl-diphosphate delta-isomerase
MEKLAAHQNGGQLHRAFSVLVFNSKKELLIQQRALMKYHCP